MKEMKTRIMTLIWLLLSACALAAQETWNPGKDNALNLKGTLRTLDQVTGDSNCGQLEDGILSRDGWAILDESPLRMHPREWTRCPRTWTSKWWGTPCDCAVMRNSPWSS